MIHLSVVCVCCGSVREEAKRVSHSASSYTLSFSVTESCSAYEFTFLSTSSDSYHFIQVMGSGDNFK